MTPAVSDATTVQVRPLFMRPSETDADEWIVGYAPTDTAVALPEIGVRAIEQLQNGATIGSVHTYLLEHYQEDIDVVDLVTTLTEIGLIQSLDSQEIAGERPIRQGWLSRIPPRAVAWFYAPPLLLLSLIMIILGPLFWIIDATTHHQTLDILWNDSFAVDTLSLFGIGMLLLFVHECGHLLAARAFGVPAELTFGHRLFFLVAVSRVGGIWQLPRWQRLVIYCGGIRNDLSCASLGAISLFLADRHILPMSVGLHRLIGFLVISLYLGVAWELLIFLKTDIYHVLADLTNQHDLPERTHAIFAGLWRRLLRGSRQGKLSGDGEASAVNRFVVAYTLITTIGVTLSCVWLIWFLVPASLTAFVYEWQALITGITTHHLVLVIDSGFALGVTGVSFGLLFWSWSKTVWARRFLKRVATQYAHLRMR